MKDNLVSGAVFGGVALLIVVLGLSIIKPTIVVNAVNSVLGSASSPSVIGGIMEVEGVQTLYKSSGFNSASTTICSFKSPAATSTLAFGSVKISTATSTAIVLEMGKSTSYAATTTRISYVALGSGAQVTLNAFVASTTGTYGSLGQYHTADETDLIFAPNTYFNVKYGASAVGPALGGSCKAEFVVN